MPDVRWAVHFETADGRSDWVDHVAKHPAGAKRQAFDELDRLGHEIETVWRVARTDAKQSRTVLKVRLGEDDTLAGRAINGILGMLFDMEKV